MTKMMNHRHSSSSRPRRRAAPAVFVLAHVVLALLLLLLMFTSSVKAITVEEIFEQAKADQTTDDVSDSDMTVGVYYYPWHGDDFHRGSRNDGYLRSKLTPPSNKQHPMLGEYDDRRPAVVSQHLQWSKQANVNLWVCSWWGPFRREDETIRSTILKHTELSKQHKIALLYEGGGRGIKASDGWDTSKVYPDMEYICTAYFNHPNYYRIQNKPVIVIYLSRQMHNKGVLTTVLQEMRRAAMDKCGMEIFIIGDHVWNNPPAATESTNYEPFQKPHGLDAVTNYDVYGNVGSTPYALQENIDNHYAEARKWKAFASSYGVAFVPGVAPGYNDRGVRLPNDNPGLSRRLDSSSEHGTLFAAHLVQARQLTEESIDNLLLVNSWNEWHEDSQIEPVGINESPETRVATLPNDLTNGIDYECYGTKYLDILRRATCPTCPPAIPEQYRGILLRKDPFETDPPPPIATAGVLYYTTESDRASFRNRLSTRQNLVSGDYGAIDATVVSKHLEMSREANIGVWIVEWTGQNKQQDVLLRTEILARSDLQDLQISILYQARGRVNEQTWDFSNVVTDMNHFFQNIAQHDHFYKVQGRPVIFLSLTRWFHTKGKLRQLVEIVRKAASDNGVDKVFVVGDQVWLEAPIADDYEPFQLLDAVTNIDVYGNLRGISSGLEGEQRLGAFYQRARDWRDFAWKAGAAYIPSVIPGWNNRGSNPERNDPVVSRQLNATAGQGSFFEASLQRARYLVDSTLSGLVVVSSFNRFREETQIEPVVGKVTSEPAELTQSSSYYGYNTLYLDMLKEYTRELDAPVDDEPEGDDFFAPLPCNSDLDKNSCSTKWSDVFGSANIHDNLVTIPCGQCIVLDSSFQTELILKGGLDILGMLYIPDSQISISTPFIRVQGEFHIDAMGPVNGSPKVEIKFIDSERLGIEKFIPASSNAFACGVGRCEPGPKSVFVAGGRVVYHGMPIDSPTWVTLSDIVPPSDEVLPEMKKPLHCPTSGVLIKENFQSQSSASQNGFRPNLGTSVEIHGTFWELKQRRSTYNGAHVDLKEIKDCLSTSEQYEFTLKVRMVLEGSDGSPTACAATGTDCIKIFADYMKDSLETQISEQKYSGSSNLSLKYGEWAEVKGTIDFTDAELDSANVYLSLRVAGGESGADIELDKFTLHLAQNEACSESRTDCRDLVTCNGGADYAIITPFSGTGGGQPELRFDEETENSFWHLEDGGMAWNVPTKCMVEHAVYKLEMKMRSEPTNPSPTTVVVYMKGPNIFEEVGTCTERAGEWATCFAFVKISSSLLEVGGGISMHFTRVQGGAYDIDDLSVRFSHMDSPVTELVVPSSINDKWTPGAQVMITSQSLSSDMQEVRTVENVEAHGHNRVKIKLDSAIPSPMTKQDGDFPVHVALLSRNIAIREGHLTVQRTPALVQKIKGVSFHKIQGDDDADRKPIRIYQSRSLEDSDISMNSITESNGCIEIVDSDHISMADNVAFQTSGHCFVVKGGDEKGISMKRNLGAQTAPSSDEDMPATFRIANAWEIDMEENVAAGSHGLGFDVTLPSTDKTDPFQWKNNVAYSNSDVGIRLHSIADESTVANSTVFLEGIQAYRNSGVGLSLRLGSSTALSIESSLFADNQGGVVIESVQKLSLRNLTLFGQSPSFYLLQQSQDAAKRTNMCTNGQSYAGIDLSPSTSSKSSVHIRDIHASGFFHADNFENSCHPHVLRVTPSSDLPATDVSAEIIATGIGNNGHESSPNVDFCSLAAENNGAQVFVIDQDGSMLPKNDKEDLSPSIIVPNGHSALTFVPPDTAIVLQEDCAQYLPSTCLRTVHFFIDPKSASDIELKLCDRATLQLCNTYTSVESMGGGSGDSSSPFNVYHQKYFVVTLPEGRYEAMFLDGQDNRVWPTFVQEEWNEVHCKGAQSGYLEEGGSIWLPPPTLPWTGGVDTESCTGMNLLRFDQNGSAWISAEDGMDLLPTSATSSVSICETADVRGKPSSKYLAGQYLDTRCLVEKQEYVVDFRAQALFTTMPVDQGDEVDVARIHAESAASVNRVPEVGILFTSHDGRTSWIELLEFDSIVGAAIEESNVEAPKTKIGPSRPREVEEDEGDDNGRRVLRGEKDEDDADIDGLPSTTTIIDSNAISDTNLRATIELDYHMANAASAFFFIRRKAEDTVATRLCVDSIVMKVSDAAAAA